jgi:phosphoglucosamine mutase
MSNLGFEEFLKKKLGIKLIRTNVGDVNVIEKMKKQKYSLGGEQSGHIILGNYLGTGDGILAALKILEIFYFKKIKASKLFDLYDKCPQIKINIPIKKMINKELQRRLNKLKNQYIKTHPDLRLLVRESGTEPLIRILVEGKDKGQVKSISLKLSLDVKRILNA